MNQVTSYQLPETLALLYKSADGRKYFDQIEFNNSLALLGKSVVDLMKELPIYSPLRQPLICHFSKSVNPTILPSLFNISRSTIYRSLQKNNNNINDNNNSSSSSNLLYLKYPINIQRIRYKEGRKELEEWIKLKCPVPSGSPRTVIHPQTKERVPVHLQTITNTELYEEYKIEFGAQGKQIHSYNFVVRMKPYEVISIFIYIVIKKDKQYILNLINSLY